MKQWSMRYKEPAVEYYEALPLGNGHMGAMVYGGWKDDRVGLNLDTLWSGPGQDRCNKNPSVDWELVRSLILEHKYEEVQKYLKKNVLGDYVNIYLPAGDMHLSLQLPKDAVPAQYERVLNLNDAIHTCTYTAAGIPFEKEMFVSLKEKLFVTRIRAGEGKRFSLDISLGSQLNWADEPRVRTDEIALLGEAPTYGGLVGGMGVSRYEKQHRELW